MSNNVMSSTNYVMYKNFVVVNAKPIKSEPMPKLDSESHQQAIEEAMFSRDISRMTVAQHARWVVDNVPDHGLAIIVMDTAQPMQVCNLTAFIQHSSNCLLSIGANNYSLLDDEAIGRISKLIPETEVNTMHSDGRMWTDVANAHIKNMKSSDSANFYNPVCEAIGMILEIHRQRDSEYIIEFERGGVKSSNSVKLRDLTPSRVAGIMDRMNTEFKDSGHVKFSIDKGSDDELFGSPSVLGMVNTTSPQAVTDLDHPLDRIWAALYLSSFGIGELLNIDDFGQYMYDVLGMDLSQYGMVGENEPC